MCVCYYFFFPFFLRAIFATAVAGCLNIASMSCVCSLTSFSFPPLFSPFSAPNVQRPWWVAQTLRVCCVLYVTCSFFTRHFCNCCLGLPKYREYVVCHLWLFQFFVGCCAFFFCQTFVLFIFSWNVYVQVFLFNYISPSSPFSRAAFAVATCSNIASMLRVICVCCDFHVFSLLHLLFHSPSTFATAVAVASRQSVASTLWVWIFCNVFDFIFSFPCVTFATRRKYVAIARPLQVSSQLFFLSFLKFVIFFSPRSTFAAVVAVAIRRLADTNIARTRGLQYFSTPREIVTKIVANTHDTRRTCDISQVTRWNIASTLQHTTSDCNALQYQLCFISYEVSRVRYEASRVRYEILRLRYEISQVRRVSYVFATIFVPRFFFLCAELNVFPRYTYKKKITNYRWPCGCCDFCCSNLYSWVE